MNVGHAHIPQVLRRLALAVLCAAVSTASAARGESTANVNLLKNPSFEDAPHGGRDEKLVPGWNVRFRAKETEPGLTAEEVSIVDDPGQAHSGKRCLRIQPRTRSIELQSRATQGRFCEPGLYEVSVWVRGRQETRGAMSCGPLPGNNFWGVVEQWRKIKFISYCKGGDNASPLSLYVWWSGEAGRGQVKNPVLFIDDATVMRLTSGLADVFGDHMVLQRDKRLPVWGWAKDAGQAVTVKFNRQTKTAFADKDGRWEVSLDPMPAGGPFVLELDGHPAACDVMMGDVWLCSGQSNMEMGVDKLHGEWAQCTEVLAGANCPQIRIWHASKQFSPEPIRSYVVRQNTFMAEHQAVWNVCTPDTIGRGGWGGFSALAYFFGREIQADQKVAVGLMQVANGGTAIEAWMSAEAMRKIPPEHRVIPPIAQMTADKVKIVALPPLPDDVSHATAAYAEAISTSNGEGHGAYNYASACFNSLVAPVFPMALRGVLWNQGEHNGSDLFYAEKLKALIADWRAKARQEDLPFIITQLCNWENKENHFHWVREAQLPRFAISAKHGVGRDHRSGQQARRGQPRQRRLWAGRHSSHSQAAGWTPQRLGSPGGCLRREDPLLRPDLQVVQAGRPQAADHVRLDWRRPGSQGRQARGLPDCRRRPEIRPGRGCD